MNPNNLSITAELQLAKKRIAEKKRKRTDSEQQVSRQQVPKNQDSMQQVPKNQDSMQHICKQKNSKQQVPKQQVPMQQVPKQQVPKQQVPIQQDSIKQIPPEKKRRTIPYDSQASSSSSVKPNSVVLGSTNMTKPRLASLTNSKVQTQQLEPPLLRKQETDFYSVQDDFKKLNVKASTPQASPTPTDGTNDERGKKHPPTMRDIINRLHEIQKEKDNSP